MDNQETLATLGTQYKDKQNTHKIAQHKQLKRRVTRVTRTPSKTGDEPRYS